MKRVFKDGQTVLFQGDSVTDCGRKRRHNDLGPGYPAKVKELYEIIFPDNCVNFVNRGVSGDRVRNLLERYDEDFLKVKPDYISILIGINDTWRFYDNNDKNTTGNFINEYETLLTKIKHDMPNAVITLIVPFVTHALPDRAAWHEDLDPKVVGIYELAKKYANYVVPLDTIFDNAQRDGLFKAADIAADGVHPTDTGHAFIALEYLKSLGIL